MGQACGRFRVAPPAASGLPRKNSFVPDHLSKGTLHDKYELSEHVLGQGSFAVVKTCRDRETGELCACKTISKYIVPNVAAVDAKYLNAEIEILRRAGSHPNILQAPRFATPCVRSDRFGLQSS